MIAIESGPERIGQWISERRDVRADYRLAFGEEPGRVDAVAIMTDTDNTGATATAWYGDIWFTKE
jgi:head-tail adaptor